MGGKIKRASFDRAFHTTENQEKLAAPVDDPCIPMKGHDRGRKQQEEASVEFRQARQRHPGIESAIGALQAGNGQGRCRDKSKLGYELAMWPWASWAAICTYWASFSGRKTTRSASPPSRDVRTRPAEGPPRVAAPQTGRTYAPSVWIAVRNARQVYRRRLRGDKAAVIECQRATGGATVLKKRPFPDGH